MRRGVISDIADANFAAAMRAMAEALVARANESYVDLFELRDDPRYQELLERVYGEMVQDISRAANSTLLQDR